MCIWCASMRISKNRPMASPSRNPDHWDVLHAMTSLRIRSAYRDTYNSTLFGWHDTVASIWSGYDDCWLPPSWGLGYVWELPSPKARRLPPPSTRGPCPKHHLGQVPHSWRWHSGDREQWWIRTGIECLSHSPELNQSLWSSLWSWQTIGPGKCSHGDVYCRKWSNPCSGRSINQAGPGQILAGS